MVAVTIAVIVGTAILLTTLRGSLIDEIDRSNLSRVDDITSQWDSENELIVLGAGFDTFTFAAVLDTEGYYDVTDPDIESNRVLQSITRLGQPMTIDFDLNETSGDDRLRAIAVLATEPGFISDRPPQLEPDDSVVFVGSSLEPVDATVLQVLIGATIIGPLFVLLVGVLTWFLTGRSLRSVEAIRREVENISSTGLDRRVPEPTSKDEIGRLAGTMNRMLVRLETSQHAQQQFVSDASHELRSPLASMSAILDVAERHGSTNEWPQTASDLQRETGRMRRMVDDLLLLARADAGQRSSALAPGSMRSLVDLDVVVLDVIRTTPRPDGISIDATRVSAGLASGNPDELRRVVINLLDNAIRHAASVARVAVREEGSAVMFTVEDDGPGIAAQDRSSVFDRFVRLDDARSRDAGGSGLGLAIAREIMTAHGGSIEVGESDLGGARFTCSLPGPV
ncbi:MAG: signal transduction histidine kinase [Verrucomicrobiales bacterium]|jgi:signal transduction histidine kinase